MFESIVEQATNELIEHLSRKADNTVKTKNFSSDCFEWLLDYCKKIPECWGDVVVTRLSWAHKNFDAGQKNISDYYFESINKISTAIDDLVQLFPETENVKKILPVLVAGYMYSEIPKTEEENSEASGLLAHLRYGTDMSLPPSRCRMYIKKFLPNDIAHGGFKSQKIEKLLESQALFRRALYLDIFLCAIIQYYQHGLCDIHASVECFERRSELLKLYLRFDLNELLSLTDEELYDKLNNALPNKLYNHMNYIEFGARVLYRLCVKETSSAENAKDMFDKNADKLYSTLLPFDPAEALSDLGYQTSFEEGFYNQRDDNDDDDDDDDDDDTNQALDLDSLLRSCSSLIEGTLQCIRAKQAGANANMHIPARAQVKQQIKELINKLYDLDELLGADGQMGR